MKILWFKCSQTILFYVGLLCRARPIDSISVITMKFSEYGIFALQGSSTVVALYFENIV